MKFFNSCFYVIRYFIRELNHQNYFTVNQTKTTNKFVRLKTKTFFKKKSNLTGVNFMFKKFNLKLTSNFSIKGGADYFFNAFFLMNQISLERQQSLHHSFYLFGASKTREKIIFIEPRKFFKK